ncbi:MAG TPA: hypothetical protein VKE51_03875 [Vicinamibacterales bacterium]|nr:hypothetical protein [Vicinamibacterales bacterium]
MKASRVFMAAAGAAGLAACSSSSAPLSPNATSASAAAITAPTPDAPADGAAAGSYRPTLVVKNGTSTATSGIRLYEFQVSDRSDFAVNRADRFTSFAIVANKSGIPEGAGGTTSYTPDFDLQPTTRFYWRSRIVQGAAASDWSSTRSFTTPIAGFNRPGELYDPLVYGSTIGTPVGSTTFVPGRGIRLNDGNSYVRYQLAQPINGGEFSMEVEGLRPNGPGPKLKVFSMSDGTGDVYRSSYLLVAQYRGVAGNPDNSIAFKALLGDPAYKLEPDFGGRTVIALDPSRAYFWKGTWSNFFRLQVNDGIGGASLYDLRLGLTDIGFPAGAATYNPTPHFAYLGANNGPFGEEDGSFPGATYRNVWIGAGPRPASLGSALQVVR